MLAHAGATTKTCCNVEEDSLSTLLVMISKATEMQKAGACCANMRTGGL